jgi:hypothetical protein
MDLSRRHRSRNATIQPRVGTLMCYDPKYDDKYTNSYDIPFCVEIRSGGTAFCCQLYEIGGFEHCMNWDICDNVHFLKAIDVYKAQLNKRLDNILLYKQHAMFFATLIQKQKIFEPFLLEKGFKIVAEGHSNNTKNDITLYVKVVNEVKK